MDKNRIIGHFLRDPRSNILWLHTYTYDEEYYLKELDLDFHKCIKEEHEIISAVNFGVAISSADLVVAKNNKGLYSVLSPYKDSMGWGAIYASITPGFTFKSVYGFAKKWDIYILGEDNHGKWGMIRISHMNSIWHNDFYVIANEIVNFDYDSMAEALAQYPIVFTIKELLGNISWGWSRGMGDITNVKDEDNFAESFDGCGIIL